MHDVFISYEHQSKSIADNIVNYLESRKIRCWYAPRDVIGDYATSICDAIEGCKVFVIVLNEQSSKSKHCLNEVEMAYLGDIEGGNETVIMPFKVDNTELNRAMRYYVQRLHWIDASNTSLDSAIHELYEKIAPIVGVDLRQPKPKAISGERKENKYDVLDEVEVARLETQLRISKAFDQPVYDRAIDGRSGLTVLDIGSNNGNHIMDRVGMRDEVSRVIGIEFNEEEVLMANEKFGATGKAEFFALDIEASDFESSFNEILAKVGIRKFDLINLSMIVLHLKNPAKLFKVLRKHIADGGRIIVKDIDDGLNFANPDPDGDFERVMQLCVEDDYAGYRYSGRQIFTYLSKAGFGNIKLERSGLSTIGMSFDERQALFDTYFDFILGDLKLMVEQKPDNAALVSDYEWLRDKFSDIEDAFHDTHFVFSLGFMIYSAGK